MHTEVKSTLETRQPVTKELLIEQRGQLPGSTAENGRQRQKVAYIMSRFPKITETFVLYEMLALEEQQIQVEVYPLQREHTKVMHPEAIPFVERAHFQP